MRAVRWMAAVAIAAGAIACGDKCPTETPAQVQAIGSCTAPPGATVSVPVRLCPTCNQTGASCSVDTSQAGTGYIQLDPTVEACANVSTCSSQAPACEANPLTCTFTVPSGLPTYKLVVFDPSTNQQLMGTLTVSASSAASCERI
jgi:hypothetical protein